MTKDEFISTCTKSGYCNKKIATTYTNKHIKEQYDENDIIEVYRIVERAMNMSNEDGRFQRIEKGVKTTKRFKLSMRMGSDRAED